MRDLIEAVNLTEGDGEFPADIQTALQGVDQAMDHLAEAIEAETRRYLSAASKQWPNCCVGAFTGHGMTNMEVYVTPEMVAQVLSQPWFQPSL